MSQTDCEGYPAPMDGLVLNEDQRWSCPKCGSISGDAWQDCEGNCPLIASPHYRGDIPL